MVRKIFTRFLAFFFPLFASASPFFEDPDPNLFHQINVVTGQLNLTYEDIGIEGVVPYAISRTYQTLLSNYQREEKNPWVFRGGWTLLAHGKLHLEAIREMVFTPDGDGRVRSYYYKFYPCITEKNGSTLSYFTQKHFIPGVGVEHVPGSESLDKSPHPNPRRNPLNNRLILGKTEATLLRADGSVWHYSGKPIKELGSFETDYSEKTKQVEEWNLDLEVLPSKHRIAYQYDDANTLRRIEVQNPSGTKTFGFFEFDSSHFQWERKLKIRSSEGSELEYNFQVCGKKSLYLEHVLSPFRPHEQLSYQPCYKKQGLRVIGIAFSGQNQLGVTYYRDSVSQVRHLLLPESITPTKPLQASPTTP